MLMITRTALVTRAETVGPSTGGRAGQLALLSLLGLSAWSGLLAGLLEVGTTVVRKQVFDSNQLLKMSRHFVWLIPLSNFAIFLALGFFGCAIVLFWPRRGRWLFYRILGALMLLPVLLVAFPRIYTLAWLIVALGLAARLVPLFERAGRGFRRFVVATLPVAVAVIAMLGASVWLGDIKKQWRENERTLPPAGSPNVLLIVLDTVAAGHLSLYGYERATSTSMSELAGRGIRFDAARASSSWTLPSHATMFTGRWLHELSVGWFTPLDKTHPTLAEFLADRGYATAGFVANTGYCAADTGLSRGFTRYEDFIFPELTALKTAVMADRALEFLRATVYFSEDWLESAGLLRAVRRLVRSIDDDRKVAAVVNRELLKWLAQRHQPERPFFAFLNYFDAHYPYQLPPGRLHRFGVEPTDANERYLIQQWGVLDKETVSPNGVAYAAAAYDDCIADLDEQIGKLIDLLRDRGDLDRTWLFVTADHGESFGEHAGYFGHGTSLYDTELHVPLVIIPPGGIAAGRVVKEAVSLRDLPATIVDVVGQAAGAPFPGDSLARFCEEPSAVADQFSVSPSLAEVVPYDQREGDYWTATRQRPPLGALKGREWSYIRREADGREQLFRLNDDAKEHHNLAGNPSMETIREQMHKALDGVTGGPLSPERFNR
jgi:arylsulfatase A-like enzyme